jgi:hypothetical protein
MRPPRLITHLKATGSKFCVSGIEREVGRKLPKVLQRRIKSAGESR